MNIKKLAALSVTLVILIGAIVDLSAPVALAAETDTLPTSFNTDYNDMPYSTPAKTQDKFGLCWAFAAVACAEADAIKNHGADKTDIDLSEWHLAYFAYNGKREDAGGDSVSLSGSKKYYEVGGFDIMSALTLSCGIGFADESVAPYETLIAAPDTALSADVMNSCEYRINNVICYDITTEREAVKAAIYEYGAVSVSYHSDRSYLNDSSSFFSSATYAQYCGDSAKAADHAVTIVGWDDNYSKSNFNRLTGRPQSNGAWLVKNSWGESFGLNGYFWISYEDATLTGGTVYDIVPVDTYDNIYQHDGGITLQYVTQSENNEILNIFTANKSDRELLTSVGISAVDLGKTNSYTLTIYSSPKLTSSKLSYDKIVHTQTGVLHDGFNTIELSTLIELEKGDIFAISVTTDAGLMVDAFSSTEITTGVTYVSNAHVGTRQTLYSEGSKWSDASEDPTPWNARIKAHTVLLDVEVQKLTPTAKELPTTEVMLEGQPVSDFAISGGIACDPVTGESLKGEWKYENSSLTVNDGDFIEIVFVPEDLDHYTTLTVRIRVDAIANGNEEEPAPDDGTSEPPPVGESTDEAKPPEDSSNDETDTPTDGDDVITDDIYTDSNDALFSLICLVIMIVVMLMTFTVSIAANCLAWAVAITAGIIVAIVVTVKSKKEKIRYQ